MIDFWLQKQLVPGPRNLEGICYMVPEISYKICFYFSCFVQTTVHSPVWRKVRAVSNRNILLSTHCTKLINLRWFMFFPLVDIQVPVNIGFG